MIRRTQAPVPPSAFTEKKKKKKWYSYVNNEEISVRTEDVVLCDLVGFGIWYVVVLERYSDVISIQSMLQTALYMNRYILSLRFVSWLFLTKSYHFLLLFFLESYFSVCMLYAMSV